MDNTTLFFISFLSGFLGAWGIMKYGDIIGINDIPNNRSSHSQAIPKCGGIGVLLAFIFCSLMLSIPLYFWLPGLVLSLVSFWGDRFEITPKIRLLIQFACAFIFLGGLFFTGQTEISGLFFLPLAVFITGTSNFYNFMDGIDGIAGITGCIAFFLLWVFNNLKGIDEIYGLFCIAMVFSCIGFLFFNMPKARVFMGDVGSILLGFIFSCLMIILSVSPMDFLIMAGFLFPFYLDELFSIAVRIRIKNSLFKPHRKHIYQLLANEMGIDHWKVSLGYAFSQLLIGMALILAGSKGYPFLFLVYGITCTGFLFISLYVWKKVYCQ
ncbi:MAG: glycosyltransferase family 4 protein [Deltaproteobacteria bacterium]|jgi:Fuc2NAc and GlcNAc transferase|nr:glycosyltransferase family 4 protein [Deltaproteobacteria bacterium]